MQIQSCLNVFSESQMLHKMQLSVLQLTIYCFFEYDKGLISCLSIFFTV